MSRFLRHGALLLGALFLVAAGCGGGGSTTPSADEHAPAEVSGASHSCGTDPEGWELLIYRGNSTCEQVESQAADLHKWLAGKGTQPAAASCFSPATDANGNGTPGYTCDWCGDETDVVPDNEVSFIAPPGEAVPPRPSGVGDEPPC
jgi:hypothetical protein